MSFIKKSFSLVSSVRRGYGYFFLGSVKASRITPVSRGMREIREMKLEHLHIQLRVSLFISFPMRKFV
jgi:hypothetical protein